jgi:hypothetical protein
MRPTPGTTIQRPDLAAIAYEYMYEQSRDKFIGLQLFPAFPVPEVSADYPFLPIEAIMKLSDTKRAPRGNYNRDDWEFETKTYTCAEYGKEEPVDDVERKLYTRFFDAEEIAVMRAVDVMLRSQEKRIADIAFNTGNFANAAVSVEWDTASTCTPRSDVITAKKAMRTATGLLPNSIVMTWNVFTNLFLTAEIMTAFRYTNPVELGGFAAQKSLLAQYFGVQNVLIGDAMYDASKKGKAFSLTEIWDDEYVGLFVVSGGKDLKEPSVGRTFVWEKDSPATAGLVIEAYREEQKRANVYRARHYLGHNITFAGAGYLLTNITT